MSTWSALDGLAGRQQGLVTLRQCTDHGLTRRQVHHRVRVGTMIVVRPGVYRWCGTAPTWRMMAMAAVLAAGDGAVLSHGSAAVLWGFVPKPEEGPLEITHPSRRRLAGVRAHRHALVDGDLTRRHGIPVTTVERTLVDLAETCPAPALGRHVDEALRRGLTTIPRLAAVFGATVPGGRRRRSPMAQVLTDRGAGYDPGANEWEQEMDRMWDQMGLPPARRQYRIRAGSRSYIVDRAIPELKIAVEWNGRAWHGSRSAFERDSNRRADLVQAGWLVLDFTPRSGWERICRTVGRACDYRRREMGAQPVAS